MCSIDAPVTKSFRRLVADGSLFLWRMSWRYDLDGERIVNLTVFFAEPGSDPPRRRGKPLRARFLSREPEYPAPTAVALPSDVRAAIDRGRELGWDGDRMLWLLPASDLQRPGLVLTGPSRLREWAGASRVFIAGFEDGGLAEPLAGDLGALPVAEELGAAEAQWRSDRFLVRRSRFGGWSTVYTRSVEDLGAVLATAARRAPTAGASVSALSAQVSGPGASELPKAEILPPEHWASHPGAKKYRGSRDSNVIWVLPEPGGLRIESYDYHPDAPERLWRWTSLQGDLAIERRFRR